MAGLEGGGISLHAPNGRPERLSTSPGAKAARPRPSHVLSPVSLSLSLSQGAA